MSHRFLLCVFLFSLAVALLAMAQPAASNEAESNIESNIDPNFEPSAQPSGKSISDPAVENWDSSYGAEEGGGSSYLGVDIADVSAERLSALKLKEEHGAEVTMVDQDAPAGKAGLHEHDVIVSLNGTAVESAAQLRRMIKETPSGRVVSLGISRDGQPLEIKVQLADRRKSMAWEPHMGQMPEIQPMPAMPDFDLPVSVVVVHSSARSGLMVENISPQLGEFFGVKDGKGVLVRSVEKGSRGEKAGFRAGDVVVKVNNQPMHDASDFTHALRSSGAGNPVNVTVIREKKEQNLILTLPERKDSGSLMEDSFDLPNISAVTEEAINRAEEEIAHLNPAMMDQVQQQATHCRKMEETLRDSQRKARDSERKLLHELTGEWAEI